MQQLSKTWDRNGEDFKTEVSATLCYLFTREVHMYACICSDSVANPESRGHPGAKVSTFTLLRPNTCLWQP